MATAAATTSGKRPHGAGPDGVTVTLLTVAAFLATLALLASQMRASPARPAHRVVVVRRVYETRVVETVVGGAGGSSVTQSVSGTPATALAPVPTTRSS